MLCFFNPSFNNHCVLNTAKSISDSDQLSRFLNTISEHDFSENISQPDTKWFYVSTTNITFYVNKLENAPIGHFEKLPNFVSHNQGVYGLITDANFQTLYRDFLCFFIV